MYSARVRFFPATIVPLFAAAVVAPAKNEIGFVEKFALSGDRSSVLVELTPASEDWFYYHALHFQNTRDKPKLAALLDAWRKQSPAENARRRTIENREALLDFEAAPAKTTDYLKRHLKVRHDHVPDRPDGKPDLPTALDPGRISREVFVKDALSGNDFASLSEAVMARLVSDKVALTASQRRVIHSKLTRPNVPGIVEFIAADLKEKDAPKFGDMPVHRALLPEQLDALAKLLPELSTNEAFVFTKTRKLAPSADVDLATNDAEREAWLTRVLDYVRTLPPAFNTLKAQVLYRRLDHDRRRGVYDEASFTEYLRLPRDAHYVNPAWIERERLRGPLCDLGAILTDALPLPMPPGNEEAIVREYFLNIFDRAAAANPGQTGEGMLAPWTGYVRDTWLRPVLAEALITGGHGNPERWAAMLTPGAFQALKDRVDIEFPRTNPAVFMPGAEVQFGVTLKNTPDLIVRIYELNALNFFLTQNRQLNTDVNLDGLVANVERTETLDEGPFKRVRRTFKFPEMKGRRGAWIVEFIGGGRSSRALIRVGQWQVIQHTGPAGDLLTVLDESGAPVKDAVAWLDGRKYIADERAGGRITVPFTAKPGPRPVIVGDAAGTFATLTQFDNHAESYTLDAQFHIEREQLLSGRKADICVRTALLLGSSHLDPALIKEARLTVTTRTHDGIHTTQEFKNLAIKAGEDFTQTISVPQRLATVSVALNGHVELLSKGGEKAELQAAQDWSLNQIETTDAVADGHLSKIGAGYFYELLGKNGEPLPDKQVVFEFTLAGFPKEQVIPLKTDAQGRISLGKLDGIAHIAAQPAEQRIRAWRLEEYARTLPDILHAGANVPLRIPVSPDRVTADFSLLELRAETAFADLSAKLEIKDGFLHLPALAAGDYQLSIIPDNQRTDIKVSAGRQEAGWLLGGARNLELTGNAPLQITGISADAEFITVKLANVTPFTRVHIAATRFVPDFSLFDALSGFTRFGPATAVPAKLPNLFSTGRDIGDEYRYILERRHTKRFPGNMLSRPGLLINPWETRDTSPDELTVAPGRDAEASEGQADGQKMQKFRMKAKGSAGNGDNQACLDFLAVAAPVIYNLVPNKDGTVKIERKSLGDRQHVQVLASDLVNAVWQSLALPDAPAKFTDLRLQRGLDPVKPFAERREVAILEKGRSLTLDDILTSEMETYDTLAGIHALFTTLSGDPRLAEFAWLLEWPKLDDAAKRAKYGEFACHELNLFLSRKDPAFFDTVIKPHLANKKDRTFMDDLLLGRDLAKYTAPWEYERLNAAERTLLATRIPREAPPVARNLRELWELLPHDAAREERLFETALRGRALDENNSGGGGFGREKANAANDRAGRPVGRESAPEHFNAPAKADSGPMANRQLERKLASGLALDTRTLDETAEMLDADPAAHPAQPAGAVLEKASEARFRKNALSDSIVAGKRLGTAGGIGASSGEASDLIEAETMRGLAYFGNAAAENARKLYRANYRTLGAAKEWAENNYYKLRIHEQNAALIPVNAFWRDYATWIAAGAQGGFISANIAEASRNFTEMMLALAVLDLPFDAPKHTGRSERGSFTFTAGGPVIVFHKQIRPTPPANDQQGVLLVTQSFFRKDDRYLQDGGVKIEKTVTGEFVAGVVYGASVVVTNPTSATIKADVLLQIPEGSIPVLRTRPTDSRRLWLKPYTTQTFEYHFYFPSPPALIGTKFPHFPVTAVTAAGGVSAGKPFGFQVVRSPAQEDVASWQHISQFAGDDAVFAYLEQKNLAALDLTRIAWRCKDAAFFKKITALLIARHAWSDTIFSYALIHNDRAALREWLRHRDDFLAQCGPFLTSPLLVLDPVERRTYEHLEYSPLVNQRAHRLGAEWRIANPALLGQYRAFLSILAHKPAPDPADHLAISYYLFLQDRIGEALAHLRAAGQPGAVQTRLQHEYLLCIAAMYESDTAAARAIAARHADHPVPRWRERFAAVISHLDGIEAAAASPPAAREQQHDALAATEPWFDYTVGKGAIELAWRNLREVSVAWHFMDPEFSFSSSPFANDQAARFSIIKPARTDIVALPANAQKLSIPIPEQFTTASVLIEVSGAGRRIAHARHANKLKLDIAENYGRLDLRDATAGSAVSRAYVKVYARLRDGTVRFYKDGYTDLRGRFDYASMNSPAGGALKQPLPAAQPSPPGQPGPDHQMLKPYELGSVEKLAILILSETHGSATREVAPPRE